MHDCITKHMNRIAYGILVLYAPLEAWEARGRERFRVIERFSKYF